MQIRGHLVQITEQTIVPVEIRVEAGVIVSIQPLDNPNGSIAASGTPGPYKTTGPSAGLRSPEPTADHQLQDDAPVISGFILPGFVDAHVHIESSLLIPSEFARMAVVHGTVATVSDPHEIANVCGLPGVEFMIRNGKTVPFYFNFGAPSCVPATRFETAGAALDAEAVTALLQKDEIKYLSEMMNFPGVLAKDPEVMDKIAAAKRLGKPVDGHAPGLRGKEARQYIAAGISTDHECFTAEEALDKLRAGMHILIREGSAARNFEALIPLLNDYPERMMFCSDDKHPDSLLAGHIDRLCARAVAKGIDVFKVLRAACINPVGHYNLGHGRLRPGDPADFIVVEDLRNFKVLQTYIKGQLVASNGKTHLASTPPVAPINKFNARSLEPEDLAYPLDKWGEEENIEQFYCIEALDGQLITNKLILPLTDALPKAGFLHSNPEKDILKIVVVNRYTEAPVAKSFIRNFGLIRGALASSVAHDSHNIVAVGVDDESICRAINLVIEHQGGLSCVDPGMPPASGTAATPGASPNASPNASYPANPNASRAAATPNTSSAPDTPTAATGAATPSQTGAAIPGTSPSAATPPSPSGRELILPLPVAGLMSMDDGYRVAEAYTALDNMAKSLGSTVRAPFMTLSFMALLVIPHLKLGDLGLFDGDKFKLL